MFMNPQESSVVHIIGHIVVPWWCEICFFLGEDENCHIYAPTRESMKEYLDSCNK